MSANRIYNLHRALTGKYPTSTYLNGRNVKFYQLFLTSQVKNDKPGQIIYNKKSKTINVVCKGGNLISVDQIRVENKKRMNGQEFYNGYLSKLPIEKWVFNFD